MNQRVLIVGGGIGGLCLAHGLKKHKIPFHVYERDMAQDYRAQGYRIRVAREAVEALKYLFGEETWRLFEVTCADVVIRPIPEIDAETGEVAQPDLSGVGPGSGTGQSSAGAGGEQPMTFMTQSKAYTVDRTMFRELLLRGLDKKDMTWGKALEKYTINDNGVTAAFTDGTTAEGSLLVGADGAHSVVRKQYLPNHPILDTSGRCVYGKTILTPELIETLEPAITSGGMVAIKDRSHEQHITMVLEPVVFSQKDKMQAEGFEAPEDYLYWVLAAQPESLGLPKDEQPRLSYEESEKIARGLAKHWNDKVRPIVDSQQPGQTAVLPINSVPADFGIWEPNERVTLLGDAVHLMGPTAGSGAITAIRDAESLCKLLADQGLSKDTIGKYESRMREYAGVIIQRSWTAAKYIFGQTSSEDRHIGEVMMATHTGKLK